MKTLPGGLSLFSLTKCILFSESFACSRPLGTGCHPNLCALQLSLFLSVSNLGSTQTEQPLSEMNSKSQALRKFRGREVSGTDSSTPSQRRGQNVRPSSLHFTSVSFRPASGLSSHYLLVEVRTPTATRELGRANAGQTGRKYPRSKCSHREVGNGATDGTSTRLLRLWQR
jgi:hypothetical protein